MRFEGLRAGAPAGSPVEAPPQEPQSLALPPLVRPPDDVLLAAIEAAPLFVRLRRFLEFVGDGRRLTQKGNLALADGKALAGLLGTDERLDDLWGPDRVAKLRSSSDLVEIDLVFRWARAAGFVKVAKGRVTPTRRAGDLQRRPVDAWLRSVEGLAKLGVLRHRYRDTDWFAPPWIDEQEDTVGGLLLELAVTRAEVPFDELADAWWEQVTFGWTVGALDDERRERYRRQATHDHRLLLEAFADLGVLALRDVRRVPRSWGGYDEAGGVVSITDAGVVAAYALAQAQGIGVPTAGALRDHPAGELLMRAGSLPPDEAVAELAAWVVARSPGAAAAALDEAVRDLASHDSEDGAAVRWGLLGLERCGADGEAVVRGWWSVPSLRWSAAAWLDARGLDLPGPVEPGGLLAEVARTGSAAMAVALLEERLSSVEAQVRLVEEAARVRGRAAVPFLQAVASSAVERIVAKAARKALFRVRSSSS